MGDVVAPLLLVGTALAYAAGTQASWTGPRGGRAVRASQVLAFAAALLVLLGALATPLDTAATTSLPAHMVQHLLLLAVAPPLLALAAPIAVVVMALPARPRTWCQQRLHRVTSSQARSWTTWTAGAFAVFTLTLGMWHFPPLYDAAVRNDAVHAAEHVTFVVTGTLFWWMVLAAGRLDRRGLGVLAVVLTTLPASALGVLMTLAATSWYSPYGRGHDALVDQQVAGALMWGLGGLALVVTAAGLFAGWLSAMDRRDEHASLGVPRQW